jgi:hypothetical protein
VTAQIPPLLVALLAALVAAFSAYRIPLCRARGWHEFAVAWRTLTVTHLVLAVICVFIALVTPGAGTP